MIQTSDFYGFPIEKSKKKITKMKKKDMHEKERVNFHELYNNLLVC